MTTIYSTYLVTIYSTYLVTIYSIYLMVTICCREECCEREGEGALQVRHGDAQTSVLHVAHPQMITQYCRPDAGPKHFQRIHPNILFVHGGHICSDKIKYSKKHFSNYSPIQKYFLPDASERLAYQLIVCSCHLS